MRDSWLAKVALTAIVVLACSIASYWLIRVPFFQEPDELAHADYAFEIFDVGRPFHVAGHNPHFEVAPQTRYLARIAGYRTMRYNPSARIPVDYGTMAFYRRVDLGAPERSGLLPGDGAPIPYVMYSYPPAYYVALASIFAAIYSHGSITAGFLAMRGFSVLLLAGTLILSYLSLRAYAASQRVSLLAVLAIGIFPLTTIIASYVQPDNATAFFVALSVYGIARGRRDNNPLNSDVLAMAAVSTLFLIKPHYALAAWLVTVPVVALRERFGRRQLASRIVIMAAPLVVFALSNRYLNLVGGLESPIAFVMRARGTLPAGGFSVTQALGLALDAVTSCLDGNVFSGFWSAFSHRGRHFLSEPIMLAIQVLTLCGFSCFGVAAYAIAKRIVSAKRRVGGSAILRLFIGGHAANLYVVTTAVLISVHVATGGVLELEGRYWFPMLLPLAIVTVRTIPRAFAGNKRRAVALTLAAAMAMFSLFSNISATEAMNDDFYGTPPAPTWESIADVTEMRSAANRSIDDTLQISGAQAVLVTGYAIDMFTGLAAKHVYVEIDNRRRVGASRVGLAFPSLADVFNDDRVGATGFSLEIPANLLPPGRHDIRLFVGDLKHSHGMPFRRGLNINVVALRSS